MIALMNFIGICFVFPVLIFTILAIYFGIATVICMFFGIDFPKKVSDRCIRMKAAYDKRQSSMGDGK